jgi:hypothetical protein
MKSTVRICASLRHRGVLLAVFCLLGFSTSCSGDGGEVADTEGTQLGANCTSSSGLPGTVQASCYVDGAFCEPRRDGHHCTGAQPFICPPGQVLKGWTTCEVPDGGAEQDGPETSVPAVDAANEDPADDAGGLEPGADCASNSGLSGTVVDSQSKCASREAFCEPMTDGYYCTGHEPFTCLPGQVRVAEAACESPLLVPGQATSATSVPSVDAATDAAADAGDAGDIDPGADCTSSSGLAGTVVDGLSKCAVDDAFCEQLSNGYYCTGSRPFICPPGEVQTDGFSCGPVDGGAAQPDAN